MNKTDEKIYIGKIYGMLKVISASRKFIYGRNRIVCTCMCECGNTLDIVADSLKNGSTTSCGCYRIKKLKEIYTLEVVGDKYGRLTIISRDTVCSGKVLCKCDCGNEKMVSLYCLRSGHTTSCGCYNKEVLEDTGDDLSGNKYGYLTVLNKDEYKSNLKREECGKKVKRIWWICRCSCGNIVSTSSKCLKNGSTTSCGCRSTSVIQEKVENYIIGLGYSINKEYDCTIVPKNPKTGYYLPFDIEIEELKLIIEVHGIQHYELCGIHKMKAATVNSTPEENFKYQKLKDRYKSYISYINGYNYLEIPYYCIENEEYVNLINQKIKDIK